MELPNDISALKRPVLQRLCKSHNIKANLKNTEMIALLMNIKEDIKMKDTTKADTEDDSRSPCATLSGHGNKENEPVPVSPIDDATDDVTDDVSKHKGRNYTKGRNKVKEKKEVISEPCSNKEPLPNHYDSTTAETANTTSVRDDHITSDTLMEGNHVTAAHSATDVDPSDHMTSDTHHNDHMTSEVALTSVDLSSCNPARDIKTEDTVTTHLDTDTGPTTDTDVVTTDTDTVTADTDAMITDTDTMTADTDTDIDAMTTDKELRADIVNEAGDEIEDKLNATFTIETLEEDMEDAHTVLSESINMTPAKTECLNGSGSWGSSASKKGTKEGVVNDDSVVATPPVLARLIGGTTTLPQSPLTTCVDHKSDIMDILNKRVEERKNDPNYKPSSRDGSRIPVKASITSKFNKAHEKNFKKMQSIQEVASRKRQREENQHEGDKTAKKSKVQCSSRITELATPKFVNRRKTFTVSGSVKKSVASKPAKKH